MSNPTKKLGKIGNYQTASKSASSPVDMAKIDIAKYAKILIVLFIPYTFYHQHKGRYAIFGLIGREEMELMSYFLKITEPEDGKNQLETSYKMLQTMFQMVPKVFVAQSIRPDLLEPMVHYVNRLMIETHALPRNTKELIAAYVSKLNACAY